jgi:hypothetical protein
VAGTPISAVARDKDHHHWFITGGDGGTYSVSCDKERGWGDWQSLGGSGAPAGSPITAVSRDASHLDVFVTAADGRIRTNSWVATSGWGGWRDVPGRTAAPGSQSAAVARDPNHIDLFAIAADGHIQSISWDVSGGWGNWVDIAGGGGVLGYPIHAGTDAGRIDLIVFRGVHERNLQTSTNWWDPAGGWIGWV